MQAPSTDGQEEPGLARSCTHCARLLLALLVSLCAGCATRSPLVPTPSCAQVAQDAELKSTVQGLLPDFGIIPATVADMLLRPGALTDRSKRNLVQAMRGLQ